jgi:RNA polymerase sigma-70 factor (ECF subfamily)
VSLGGGDAVAAAIARARTAWPAIGGDEGAFVTRLAKLLADDAVALDEIDVGGVWIALACAAGEGAALAALETEHLPALRPALAKLGLDATGIDEALQMLRAELLAPRADAPPRIAGYGGRGSLGGWLRTVAVRTGLRLIRATPRHDELADDTPGTISDDAELAYLKKTYGDAFQRAFDEALAALSAQDRLLLKQRFRHHMGVVELGALHGVHAGTISRRVASARDALAEATRAAMMRALGLGRGDVSSILRLIHSELDITLSSKPK